MNLKVLFVQIKSIIDYKFNAKLTFNKDSDNNSYVQFINNGWWNSEETFPLSYTFPLENCNIKSFFKATIFIVFIFIILL